MTTAVDLSPYLEAAARDLASADIPLSSEVAHQRFAAVKEALTWLGTPYHPHARLKGIGVDCAMILLEVYGSLGLVDRDFDPGYYAPDWHLHQDVPLYLEGLAKHAKPKKNGAELLPGDLLMFQFGRTASHGAILISWPLVIHAFVGKGVVLEEVGKSALILATDRTLTDGRLHSTWTLQGWE